jgi:hypothetical protein
MAFDSNITMSVHGTNDAIFKTVEENGKRFRRAILADGTEITMHISHESKKRDRHLVKFIETVPATTTTPAETISVHVVMDQGLPPNSQTTRTAQLTTAAVTFVNTNNAGLQIGEI